MESHQSVRLPYDSAVFRGNLRRRFGRMAVAPRPQQSFRIQVAGRSLHRKAPAVFGVLILQALGYFYCCSAAAFPRYLKSNRLHIVALDGYSLN